MQKIQQEGDTGKPRGLVMYEYTKWPVGVKLVAAVTREKVIAEKLMITDASGMTIFCDDIKSKEDAVDLCEFMNWMQGYIIQLSATYNKLLLETYPKKEVPPVDQAAPQVSEQQPLVEVPSSGEEAPASVAVTSRHKSITQVENSHPSISFRITGYDKSLNPVIAVAYLVGKVFAHCHFPEGVRYATQYDTTTNSGDELHPENIAQKNCKFCHPDKPYEVVNNRATTQ